MREYVRHTDKQKAIAKAARMCGISGKVISKRVGVAKSSVAMYYNDTRIKPDEEFLKRYEALWSIQV